MPQFNEQSKADFINNFPYFAAMKTEAKQEIAARATLGRWRENRYFFEAGDWLNQGYVVLHGTVEIKPPSAGASIFVGRGSVLGDYALMSGLCLNSALARTPCVVLTLEGQWYRTLAQKDLTVLRAILQHEQQRNAARETYLGQLLRAPKPDRVLLELLQIAQAVSAGKEESDNFPFEVSWYKNLSDIGAPLTVCRPKTREALEMASNVGIIDIGRYGGEQIDLPPILQPGCIERLERLIATRL